MPVEPLPIFSSYDQQRFTQFGSQDCANWYGVSAPGGKKPQALYPAMGRQHVRFFNQNRLVFTSQPRFIFRSINFFYVIVGSTVYQYDKFYNQKIVGEIHNTGPVWFAYLPVGTITYCMLTSNNRIYVITEDGTSLDFQVVTDGNAPAEPLYVAAFGNRFVVSQAETPDYYLSTINLAGNPSSWFSFGSPAAPLTNRATGIVRQFGVLHAQLYIFTDFSTDIWANIPTQFTVAGVTREFPWKLNSSYNWDFGIQDPYSLSIDFGMMCWLAQSQNGLVSFMVSNGQQPQDISTQAINVLLQNSMDEDQSLSPFLAAESDGFLYQYENSIFYRVSAGKYLAFGELDVNDSANCIEYNFDTQTWHRCIELNGERNRIKQHIYFNNKHLVTVEQDTAIYEMAGNIYHNELRNPDTTAQAPDAFLKYPMRYELVTRQIFEPDYSEFITDYVEIDFVFGDKTFYKSNAPFANTVFIVDENSTPEVPIYLLDENGAFLIEEGSNTPSFDDQHYNALFKPHIELYWSDDGGVTFLSADLREFSPLGAYRWRMRWYQMGPSRNRCYKLVCVSSAPIVILGAVQNKRRASGGAN